MANNFISGYSGSELDSVLGLFVDKGLGSITGIVKRKADGTFEAATVSNGTVTSVRVQATSPVQSSTSTEQSTSLNTTISLADAYGDTKNPYGSKTKGYVLAAPSNAAGAPSFRALVAADIPTITKSKISDFPESMPASDVSSWAKATSKPSYNFSEIGSKPTTISGYGITDAYTKTEVDGKVSGVMHYKGTKAAVANLPTTGNANGDVWHVTANGAEYAWDGTEWQELGTAVDLSGYVPTSRTVAGKALTGNITLSASDVGAASSSHTHGNITNAGALQTTDVTIASGDKLVITDSSDSNKVARASVSFDGSTTTKALTQKGTFETFLTSHQSLAGYVPTSRTVNSKALSSDITLTASDVGAATSGHTHTTKIESGGTSQIDLAANTAYTLTAGGTTYVFKTPADTNTTYTFDGTYNSSTNKAATVSTVTNAIGALDGNLNSTTPGAGKTLTAFSQTNGVVSATFGNISITKSQISDFPSSMTPTSHTHGNITNSGDITATAPTIANGDQLIINDNSESKITNGPTFDGSTTTQALTKAGTWGTFLTSHQDISGKIDTAGTGLSKSGTTLNHSNSVTAQTTQAIYPIKIDAQGHISAYGSAVTPLTASSTLDATKLSGTIPSGCYTNTTYSAGTGLSLSSGAFSVKTGYTTSGNNRAVQTDTNGNLYVVQTDTTYSRQTPASGGTTVSLVYTGDMYTWNNKASKSSTTASLTVNGWSNNSQTVNVSGVTASNDVIVSPASASKDGYIAAGIWCSAQAAGMLTFTCTTVPEDAITVNVTILS